MLEKIAREIRKKIIIMCQRGSHVGSALSAADIMTVLYFRVMNIPSAKDPERDRFILSKGHAAAVLYAILAQKGFIDEDMLDSYIENGSCLFGHPAMDALPGVEASTGSLGHGLPIGVGFALSAKQENKSYKTYVLLGDGECQEGSVWESAILATRLKLDNIVGIIDANNLQGYDRVENIQPVSTFKRKWEAFGWGVREVDGHNLMELENALVTVPFDDCKPSMIIAHTIKAKGILEMEDKLESHYLSIPKEKVDQYIKELGEMA